MRRRSGILVFFAAVIAVMAAAATPAAGHGTIDQALTGNPACTVGNFAGFTSSAGPTRQEFVPDEPGLVGVDLCLNFSTVRTVNVNIRSGTVAAPGPIISSASRTAIATGFQWFHIDLAELEQVTVG